METSEKGVKIMQDQTLNRRTFLAALGACAWPVLGEAQSADWPARLVRIITPAPAGGSTDRMARTLANEYAKALGQPFVIDNKPGAGGSIGTAAAAVAAADGYTLLMSGVFNSITPALYAQLPFNYLEDFEHIAPLFYGPNVLVVRADFPHDTLAKLVAAAKSSAKDPLYFASSGVGTSGHLTMEMFQRAAGITLMHVPYKGGAPALQDVLSGQVSIIAVNQDAVLPLVASGRLKALAITSAERNVAFPDVPTFVEEGFPDVVVTSWGVLDAPRGTPAAVVQAMRTVTMQTLKLPRIRQPFEAEGWVMFEDMSFAQLDAFLRSETERWAQIIRSAGITAQ